LDHQQLVFMNYTNSCAARHRI